ncbi:Zn-dependent protease with chaperone function [Actinoplanes octamycinicus]|uniref:Zn-dependent protease with chaperone function n=1 Tax=Actinoplanes octamycinicus TaxID=135948 RepID=A0A7W7H2N1_9ACTN|nr:M48 family metalloprotease [Actinoplanes octamycinicus]MBB4742793.1 Zn-dependent protease with chaperone function [Actinoplanes octamycinicus]GIE58352.1 hypothetical protein Aoc01nite_37540 [Actinoplanes octamycinicus]
MAEADAGAGRAISRPRPHVLALPAAGIARFALLAVALLVAGAFSGTWFHLLVGGERYEANVVACQADARTATRDLPGPLAAIARVAREDWCQAGEERRRAAFMLGGVLLTAAGAAVIVLAGPAVRERRRRLRPANPASPAARYAARLAAEMGLRRPPRVRIGRLDQKDAYSYGRPGAYRIALPKALLVARVENPAVFDAVLRHELAHLRHGDVAWSRLATSIWYLLAPMMTAPVVVALAGPGRSLLPEYLWRAAALAVAVEMVVAATLRDREFDADLSAAGRDRVEAVASALGSAPHTGGRWHVRGPLARHPVRERRLAVLRHPELATRVTFADGMMAGFLAATAGPLLVELVFTGLAGSGRQSWAYVAAALAAGLLLGAVAGLALLRAAVVGRAAGIRFPVARVALGVGIGVPLGQVVSLAGAGTGRLAGLDDPLWLLATAGFAVGATVLCAATATLLADAAGRAGTSRAVWLPAVAFGTAAYTAAMWISERVEFVGDRLGGEGLLVWAVTALNAPLVIVAATVMTVIVAGAAVAGGSARGPAWLTPGSPTADPPGRRWSPPRTYAVAALAAGAASGVAAGLVMIVNRLLRGAAADVAEQVTRYYTAVWIAAAAAVTVMLVLCAMAPERGAALAALGGPVAAGGALLALAGISTVQGLPPGPDALAHFGKLSLPLAAVLAMLAATSAVALPAAWRARSPRAALAGGGHRDPVRAGRAAVVAAASTVLIAGTIAARPAELIPPVLLTAQADQGPPTDAGTTAVHPFRQAGVSP